MRNNGAPTQTRGMTLDRLDRPTIALVSFAVRIAEGAESTIEEAVVALIAAGVPPSWVDELVLQSVLICGWPRALTAARLWRQHTPTVASGEDGTNYDHYPLWKSRGEETCREVYRETYEALRRNIRALHPALEAGMIVEGYGRILGRPALDLCRRELCTVAQIAVQGARRQLRSHLRGARNAGASVAAVEEVLSLVRPLLAPEGWEETRLLWERVKT